VGDTNRRALPPPDRLVGDAYRQARTASKPSTSATTAWRDSSHRQAPALQ